MQSSANPVSRQPEPPSGWVYPGESAKLARPIRSEATAGNGRQPEPPVDRVAVQAALDAARADFAAAQTAARVSRGRDRIAAQTRVREAGARVRRFRAILA